MYESDAEIAVGAAETGADIIRSKFDGVLTHHPKVLHDFATDADIEGEEAIRRFINGARPGDGILGEELVPTQSFTGRQWLVDPLCGTLNFAARTPLVAVNVARHDPRKRDVAAVADPFTGEVFWTDGASARVRKAGSDQPLSPSGLSRLVDLNVDAPVNEVRGLVTVRLLSSATFREAFEPRVLSTSLALTWVAAGRRAAFVTEGDLRDNVHFAAGIALCQAAGCVLTSLDGGPLGSARGGLVAASDSRTHLEIVEMIRGLA